MQTTEGQRTIKYNKNPEKNLHRSFDSVSKILCHNLLLKENFKANGQKAEKLSG